MSSIRNFDTLDRLSYRKFNTNLNRNNVLHSPLKCSPFFLADVPHFFRPLILMFPIFINRYSTLVCQLIKAN